MSQFADFHSCLILCVCLFIFVRSFARSKIVPNAKNACTTVPKFLPATYIQLTRLLVQEVLLGKSVAFALRSLQPELAKNSPYLYSLRDQLVSGASFDEALQIAATKVEGVLDKFYEIVFTSSRISSEELLNALDMFLRFAQFLQHHLSREKSRTVQVRIQFFLISAIVPILFLANVFLFPEVMISAIHDFCAGAILLFAFILYVCGICLFSAMTSSSLALLVIPKSSTAMASHTFSTVLYRFQKMFFKKLLGEEIQNLSFLVALGISLKTGRGMRSALKNSADLAAGSLFSDYTQRILHMHARGSLLKESIFSVVADLRLKHGKIQDSTGCSRVLEICHGIGSACHDMHLVVGFVLNCAEECKNSLKDLSEESTGALTMYLLLPLCFCHIPAAFLMLLCPVLLVVSQAGL